MYTMLIVDDERLLLDGLFQLFSEQQELQLSLHKASSGIEALKIIEDRKIDILLTDIKMPKMSGLELGGHASRIWPGCEIIYLTGFNEFEYVHHAIKNGALNYILKTEGDDHIVATVRQAVRELEEKQQAASLLEEAEELRKRQILHYRSQYLTDYIEGIISPEEITHCLLYTSPSPRDS